MDKSYVVYILECADGTYYTGSTNDIEKRLSAHQNGKAAKYTRGRRPVDLIYIEECGSKGNALSREHAIKALTRKGKEMLIMEGDMNAGTKKF